MSQERLLQSVISVLIMAGFDVSERYGMRPRSFDLIAGRGSSLLIIKIVAHIDSVGEENARDLTLISRYLKGTPLIIGEKARDVDLERGAVYVRYGILAASVPTIYDYFVEEIPPLIYAQPGGLYVNINSSLLRDLREAHNMSLGDLASLLGVSRRTISKYESGMNTTLDVAIRLEELFDTPIVEAIDLLSKEIPPESPPVNDPDNVPSDMERIGMEIHTMTRAPFEALALYEEETIITGYGSEQKVVRRATLIGNLSNITHTRAMCIIKGAKIKSKIGNTFIIGEKHLKGLETGSELIELIDDW